MPSAAAIAAALAASREAEAPIDSVRRGAVWGVALAGVAYGTTLLHGLRAGICDFWGGTVLFVLTAGVGSVMGGVWGAVVAPMARGCRRRALRCVLLGLAGPLAGIVVSLARFYASPTVFAYDPFFGYFSGTLYDTVVDTRPELWTYRAGSLLTLAGVALVASGWPPAARASDRWRLGLGCLGLVASLVHCSFGPELGHWETASSIARALGGRSSGARCDVIHPDTLASFQRDLLVRDCEEEPVAVEGRLGAHLEGRLTAFVFADSDQKRRLMGAADVSIAKPWRREVYLQMASYPHPVMGHEIAHVVAGSFARGPFRVAGDLGGLWPNPGLIEGTAVAASPDDDELTDAQWARAMLDAGFLPEARRLFSMAFLGQSAEKSYTVAGAFVGWVVDRWGAGTLRAWYGGRRSGRRSRASRSAPLTRAFAAGCATCPCPRRPRRTHARGSSGRASGSGGAPTSSTRSTAPPIVATDQHALDRALTLYSDALARDPHDWHARMNRGKADLRFGDAAARGAAREDLARLASDERTPRTWRDRAIEALADADVLEGHLAEAKAAYLDVAGRTLDEDAARTLEVKALAMDDDRAREAIVDLLIGQPGRAPDAWMGALSLGEWASRAPSPLADYLVGKNLGRHDEWARAAVSLDAALEGGLPTARIAREAIRQRAVAACVLRDARALGEVNERVVAPSLALRRERGPQAVACETPRPVRAALKRRFAPRGGQNERRAKRGGMRRAAEMCLPSLLLRGSSPGSRPVWLAACSLGLRAKGSFLGLRPRVPRGPGRRVREPSAHRSPHRRRGRRFSPAAQRRDAARSGEPQHRGARPPSGARLRHRLRRPRVGDGLRHHDGRRSVGRLPRQPPGRRAGWMDRPRRAHRGRRRARGGRTRRRGPRRPRHP